MLTAHCPACHHAYGVPESLAGQLTLCPACGGKFRVRGVGAPREPFGKRRGPPLPLLFAAGVLLGCGAGAAAWAFWPRPSDSPGEVRLTPPASSHLLTPGAATNPQGPRLPAPQHTGQAPTPPGGKTQLERDLEELDRLNKIIAEEKEKNARRRADFEALSPAEQQLAVVLSRKLKDPPREAVLTSPEAKLIREHPLIFDTEVGRDGIVKLAVGGMGFQRFRASLGLPDGDYLRGRAIRYATLPDYRGQYGWLVAAGIAERIGSEGRNALTADEKQYLRDNDDLFGPPLSR